MLKCIELATRSRNLSQSAIAHSIQRPERVCPKVYSHNKCEFNGTLVYGLTGNLTCILKSTDTGSVKSVDIVTRNPQFLFSQFLVLSLH